MRKHHAAECALQVLFSAHSARPQKILICKSAGRWAYAYKHYGRMRTRPTGDARTGGAPIGPRWREAPQAGPSPAGGAPTGPQRCTRPAGGAPTGGVPTGGVPTGPRRCTRPAGDAPAGGVPTGPQRRTCPAGDAPTKSRLAQPAAPRLTAVRRTQPHAVWRHTTKRGRTCPSTST